MGLGKGYLIFVFYDYFVNNWGWQFFIIGIELWENLVGFGNELVFKVGFIGLQFCVQDIFEYELECIDMFIVLYVCDIVMDIVIVKGVQVGVEIIIVVFCCYKQVCKVMQFIEGLQFMFWYGILQEWQAEFVIDGICVLLMEDQGYEIKVFEFVFIEYMFKNLMIVGIKGCCNVFVLVEVEWIKLDFGVGEYYL